MDSKQVGDREQFRRYAEAALAGMDHTGFGDNEAVARLVFEQATEMMMMEAYFFGQYQVQALELIQRTERARHGIDQGK